MNILEKRKIQYSISVSQAFQKRLNQHLFVIKKLLRPGCTKEAWLTEAVKEKLKRDKPNIVVEGEKRVNLRLNLITNQNLEERITKIRPFHYSYSKKKLILEAIHEKLEEDGEPIREQFSKYQCSLSASKEGG